LLNGALSSSAGKHTRPATSVDHGATARRHHAAPAEGCGHADTHLISNVQQGDDRAREAYHGCSCVPYGSRQGTPTMCVPQLAFTSRGAERRKEKGGGENWRKRGTAIFSDLVMMTAPHWPPPSAPIGALQARPPVRPRRSRRQISPRLAPSIPVSWLCRRRGPRTQR
jgi:hypothetical protein